MKRTHNIYLVLLLMAIGLLGKPHVTRADPYIDFDENPDDCTVTQQSDNISLIGNLRTDVNLFNGVTVDGKSQQSCRNKIVFKTTKITLSAPIVLSGSVSNDGSFFFGSEDDNNPVTFITDGIDSSKTTEKCIITILGGDKNGGSHNVTIKNVFIEGHGQALNGICVGNTNNHLVNVRVRGMGRRGIVLSGTHNQIEGSSLAIFNGGPGICLTTSPISGEVNNVKTDTIVFGNNPASTSGKINQAKCSDDTTTPADGSASPGTGTVFEKGFGQQIVVENDISAYRFHYSSKPFIANGAVNVSGKAHNGVYGNTVLMFFKVTPNDVLNKALKDITLSDSLLGFITTTSDTTDVDLGGLPSDTYRVGNLDLNGTFTIHEGKIAPALIYMVAYPIDHNTIASSTGAINMPGNSGYYNWENNKQLGDKEIPKILSAFASNTDTGNGGNGGDGSGTGGNSSDFTAVLRASCQADHSPPGTPYSTDVDSDGDGIADALEDDGTEDCSYSGGSGVETNQFDIDTDHDGIPDGLEDNNKNGYTDCELVHKDSQGKVTSKETLVPLFKGTKNSDDELCMTDVPNTADTDCEPFGAIAGHRIPHPASLGMSVDGVPWPAVPKYVVGTDGVKKLAVVGSNDKIECSETDPRRSDSDQDGLDDGEEDRHKYLDLSQPTVLVNFDSGQQITNSDGSAKSCEKELSNGPAQKAGRKFILLGVSSNTGRLQWGLCKSLALWNEDFDQNVTDLNGETDPHKNDTDGDGLADGFDPCPRDPDPTCVAQCFKGWKIWEVGQVAQLTYDMTADARQTKLQETYANLQSIMKVSTIEKRDELTALLQNIPKSSGDWDGDGIPDLVEAGLPVLGGTGYDDCSTETYKTSAFKIWTDKDNSTVPADATDVIYNDANDPCPGTKDKSCATKKKKGDVYLSTMSIYACYVDRDNDGLKDCLEDTNLNGVWDKKDEPSASYLADSSNPPDGISDFEAYNAGTSSLYQDSDNDGLPDYIEEANGTKGWYDPAIQVNAGCRDTQFEPKSMTPGFKVNDDVATKAKYPFISLYDTDPNNPDTDGDGLNDGYETLIGTSPVNPDSDNDGLCDGNQDVPGVCIAGEDTNPDGAFPHFTSTTQPETLLEGDPDESNPCDPNTDHKGKSDLNDTCKNIADESCQAPNAIGNDSDLDGIPDETESTVTGTDAHNKDTDGDGLVDGCLIDPTTKLPKMGSGELCNQVALGQFFSDFRQLNSPDCGKLDHKYYDCDTNPGHVGDDAATMAQAKDTDGDGLTDKQERTYPTNPVVADTDGDCIPDGLEDTHFILKVCAPEVKFCGYDVDPKSPPDGMWAGCTQGIALAGSQSTTGLICSETNANDPDTDKDGLPDGKIGILGEDLDCSGNQNKDAAGFIQETSAFTWDTDGDGFSDGQEMTENGGFNVSGNISRAVVGSSRGCSLVTDQTARTQHPLHNIAALLLCMVPAALWVRVRKSCES